MDIRDKIIMKQREIMELYTKYLSDFTTHFRIPNFWEKEFNGKLHEIASLKKELQEQKPVKITDEEIEKWAEKDIVMDDMDDDILYYALLMGKILGAKAMRDNEIKDNEQ